MQRESLNPDSYSVDWRTQEPWTEY